MKPSIGRIVHYVSYGTPGGEYTSQCRAAIITALRHDQVMKDFEWVTIEDTVDLCVLNPEGLFFNREVRHDESGHKGGTWHWPERVEE